MTRATEPESRGNVFTLFTGCAKIKNVTVSVKNEVMEMIAKVRERKSRFLNLNWY